jgi:leucine-rich repeat-containing G protein-coupled receptor 7/leucine-rich repeat-containing G protein-coupled receptor 8
MSCESSVLILTLITSDRLASVTRPFDRRQPSLRRATLLVAVLWLLAAVVAALPLCVETVDYFGEEFYGGNGVCLPLHVQDPFADVSGHRLSEKDDMLCLNHLQYACAGPLLQ